ncbi:ABC transporter substrate-binding protein, partial [Bacillus subtilis]
MKFKKVLRLVPVVLAGTFLLASCSGKNSSKDTLKLMQTAEIQSLDNSNVATLPQWNVLVQSMEGLYRMDKNGKPVAAMATKVVKPTNNGKTYTFHIRKDAKWSDGSKVTAQDFVTSWRRSASPSAKSGYNYIFTGIKNATKVSSGELPASDLGVKALNDTTLQVQLEY